MAIQSTTTRPHWNYFIALERDVDVLSRYVEFDQRNFDCFSIEIARLLLAAGAEIDVVCKQLCQNIVPGSRADDINGYRNEIAGAIPNIPAFEVLVPRFGLSLHPWEEWRNANGVPFWWTAYNKIKHHRDSHFHRGSLKNALNAVAGLFVVTLYLYRNDAETGELSPGPQVFWPGAGHIRGRVMESRPLYNL